VDTAEGLPGPRLDRGPQRQARLALQTTLAEVRRASATLRSCVCPVGTTDHGPRRHPGGGGVRGDGLPGDACPRASAWTAKRRDGRERYRP